MTKLESQYQDLQKAYLRLKEAVALPPTIINRDATIQRFEFTFELCWKLMNNIVPSF
ncbi:MAG: nucleotidyltransferase substrate binding protein [Microgenomates group bacterium]